MISVCLLGAAAAQQADRKAEPGKQDQPQVKVNYLNVCAPSLEDQAEIRSALAKVAPKPNFSRDFEISRGRTTMEDLSDSKFIRLRRDFAAESPLLTAQYSMSTDATNTIETLVVRLRDPKQFHELSLEDRVSANAAPASALLGVDTPVARIRLERFSKNSIVLARCPDADQSAYEPLFKEASQVMAEYRKALGLKDAFRGDIAWLDGPGQTKGAAPGARKKR
jgi:hypothetical protein